MDREVLISPDGNSVAIRTDFHPDAWNAYGVFSAINGGHWARSHEVSSWTKMERHAEEPPTDDEPVG